MQKTLFKFSEQTTDEPKSVAILKVLEKETGRRPAVEVKITGVPCGVSRPVGGFSS